MNTKAAEPKKEKKVVAKSLKILKPQSKSKKMAKALNGHQDQQDLKLTKLCTTQYEIKLKAKTIFSRHHGASVEKNVPFQAPKEADETPPMLIQDIQNDDHFQSASSIFDINPPVLQE